MAFDVKAALTRALEAEKQESGGCDTATPATSATKRAESGANVAIVANVASRNGPNPEIRATGETPVSAQMDRFRERAAMLQEKDGLPADRAAWLAAMSAFVLPDERAEYFDQSDNLQPQYQRLCLAIGNGVVVTFHKVGRVSFNRGGRAMNRKTRRALQSQLPLDLRHGNIVAPVAGTTLHENGRRVGVWGRDIPLRYRLQERDGAIRDLTPAETKLVIQIYGGLS